MWFADTPIIMNNIVDLVFNMTLLVVTTAFEWVGRHLVSDASLASVAMSVSPLAGYYSMSLVLTGELCSRCQQNLLEEV